MKKFLSSKTITTGLAIFSMFFGAGNLMYPINVGLTAGDATLWAMAGFLITAILMPTLGLVSMILFNGKTSTFFGRIGKVPGFLLESVFMMLIGPLIAMPRIVTLSHTMISPFLPMPLILFSLLFLGITFVACYKESKIMDILGYIISPTLLITLLIIIIKGFFTSSTVTVTGQNASDMFWQNLQYGYQTLDVPGGIFFATIILSILNKTVTVKGDAEKKTHQLAMMSLKAGAIGTSLLGIVYLGLSYLGAYFGHNLGNINEGEIFSKISFRVLGSSGAFIISTAVLMACFSTIIALSAIFAEYLQNDLLKGKVGYIQALIMTLAATLGTSLMGLTQILKYSAPIIEICYPALIVLMLVNIAYKVFGFKPVKLPVAAAFAFSLFNYLNN